MAPLNRRKFLKGSAAAAVGVTSLAQGARPTPPEAGPNIGPGGDYQYQSLNVDDAAILAAAVDRIIPADELSLAGSELGIPEFIDRQLAGPFGSGARWYMQGPYEDGAPTQGYQSRRPPAELMRDGLRALQRAAGQKHDGKQFTALPPEDQDKTLAAVEAGDLPLDGIDGVAFFNLLLRMSKEGFFADPMYGGNRDMAGWKMVGFPGARGNYYDWPERTDQPYPYPPVSIQGA
ncbi:gluconate 2-dehydrogenase subunit 3 family protein [uncultured Abyssibacter sp.]|uniref:gluconate 2-dehydrogenase subunit 3 family protein n=1 Tax=uncultured Abyssibacter sp. TaxID=2320202 RepID=UPI0032B250AA